MSKKQDNNRAFDSEQSALDLYYDVKGDGVLRADTSKLSNDEGFMKYVTDIFSSTNLVKKN